MKTGSSLSNAAKIVPRRASRSQVRRARVERCDRAPVLETDDGCAKEHAGPRIVVVEVQAIRPVSLTGAHMPSTSRWHDRFPEIEQFRIEHRSEFAPAAQLRQGQKQSTAATRPREAVWAVSVYDDRPPPNDRVGPVSTATRTDPIQKLPN